MADANDTFSAMAPLARRVAGLVERGTVLLTDAAKKFQALQMRIAGDETDDSLEHFEPYGFTSHPKAPDATGAAEGVVLNVGGNRDHPVVIVVGDRRYRLTGLAEGEVAIFDDQGAKIVLKRTKIQIVSNTGDTVEVSDDGTALVATDGVVHGSGIDPYTGATYFALGNASATLLAKK